MIAAYDDEFQGSIAVRRGSTAIHVPLNHIPVLHLPEQPLRRTIEHVYVHGGTVLPKVPCDADSHKIQQRLAVIQASRAVCWWP